MSRQNTGRSGFLRRLEGLFGRNLQRKARRGSVAASEALESRQMLTNLSEALFQAAELDGKTGETRVDSYLVAFNGPVSTETLMTVSGATSLEVFSSIPNAYMLNYANDISVQTAADRLTQMSEFKYLSPNFAVERLTRAVPNDALFGAQWYLDNIGQSNGTSGVDANVVEVWDNYIGRGVRIGIVDDGLDLNHPDLLANISGNHLDLIDGDTTPTPATTSIHGTGVAGVIGAVANNNIGISGTAPGVSLSGIRLLQNATTITSPAREFQALSFGSVDISNNSWGPRDTGALQPISAFVQSALQTGTQFGRGGLGRIYVWAGGNGGSSDYVNYDQYASSRYTIAVAPIDHNGQQSAFGERGSSLLVSGYSAPGSIMTTDLSGDAGVNRDPAAGSNVDPDGERYNGVLLNRDYTARFAADSSTAAATVSGVVALMLERNPNLSYRDVMNILVRSAQRNDPNDSEWRQNGAGLWVNYKYGFGAVDAGAAVAMANPASYTRLGPELSATTGLQNVNLLIPDNSNTGVSASVTSSSQLSIEHVELVLNASHTRRGDLEVTLISPDGTRSVMAESRTTDSGFDYTNWTFTSTRHWGEKSTGTWTVEVRDLVNGLIGNFDSYSLTFYGTELPIGFDIVPSVISEAAGPGAATGTVSRPSTADLSQPLTITLSSSDPSEAVVPASVTIPAGRRSATFSIDAVDDTLLDGPQNLRIVASIPSYTSSLNLTVLDQEELTLTIDPTLIFENAGAGAATVTVTRSNTDTTPPANLVAVNNELREYDDVGTLLSTTPVPWPTGNRPVGENVHDVTVMENGSVALFNGTNQVYLSVLNRSTGEWTHFAPDELSASPVDFGQGGIATSGNYVYLTDTETGPTDTWGLTRVNVTTGTVDRFGTKSFGNRLFVSDQSQNIYEISPVDGRILRQIPVTSSGTTGLAFDGKYIWYITNSSNTLVQVDADTGVTVDQYLVPATTFGYEGVAVLDGLVYLMDSFFANDIVVFDPVLRQAVQRLNVDAANAITYGISVDLSGGLAASPTRDSLYVGSTFSDLIYELDPQTGLVKLDGIGNLRTFSAGTGNIDEGLAVVGNELFVGTWITDELRRFTLDGIALGTVSVTAGNKLAYFGLGGDGVPGLIDTTNRYRDVFAGLDGLLYAVDVGGTAVGVFDPVTLAEVNFLNLAAPVRTIAVAEDGKIYGADDNGQVIEFSPTGAVLRTVQTGQGVINDIEVNIAGRMLISNVVGDVTESTTDLTSFSTFVTDAAPAFVAFGEAVNRNTAELTVTLTNSDLSEISIPLTVVIPEGSQSVTFLLDAVDDNFRDGLQVVQVTASAPGYQSANRAVTVEDVEGIVVDVVANEIRESDGDAATMVRVRRTDSDGPYTSPSLQTFANTSPLDLKDNGTVLSNIVVPSQVSWITSARVTVNFEHNWLPDLDVFLVSPSGTRVELFTDLRTNGKQMINTVLDDRGDTSILDGTAPFTGRFRPENTLLALYQQQAAGTWSLEITDDNVGDTGKLLSWSLELSTEGLSETTVTLETSDSSEASFQGQSTRTVIIPANQTEVVIDLDAEDDDLLDGPQTVIVSATAVDVANFVLGQDSVVVLDDEILTLTLSHSTVIEAQGAGYLTGTVRRNNTDISLPLTVNLSSNDTSEITVSATVVIPAGEAEFTFPITIVDDAIIDGDQLVTITAGATGYSPDAEALVNVLDQEPVLLMTTSSTTVAENSSSFEVTITRQDQADISQPMNVDLIVDSVPSGGAPTLSVPASVVIPANSGSTTFTVTVLDDTLLDGTQVAQISASAVGAITGTLQISVTDYETLTVTLNKTEVLENAGANAARGTVQRNNTDISLPLVVTLTSSDVSELTVPLTVTIPAGAASAEFPLNAINDPDLDGAQSIDISAVAAGYLSGSASLVVLDHEPPVLTGPAASTNSAQPTITWQAITGAVRYEIWLSNLSSGQGQIVYEKNVIGTSFTVPEKIGVGLYRVWVRAVDSLEIPGFWSAPRDFRVVTAPTITAPSTAGATASSTFPTISWTAITSAPRYELWVNNLTTGTARVIWRTDLTTTSYLAVAEGLGSGTYRAFARAFNAQNESGNWSPAYDFTVLAAPSMLQPASGGTFDRTPTYSWTAIPGATSYDVWVSSRTTNTVVLRDQNVRSTSLTGTVDLPNGDYTVWVRAQAGTYYSVWSAGRQFSVGAPPRITTPANNSSGNARPTFMWTSITDTERYELWITNMTTNTRVYYLTNLTTTSFTPPNNFTSGNYRVWVRAVSTMGESTAWSTPVNFTVAGVSSESADPSEIPVLQSSGNLLASVLAPAESGNSDQPEVVVNPPAEQTEVADHKPTGFRTSTIVAAAVAEISADDSVVHDAVMAGWDQSEWWNLIETPAAVNTDRDLKRRTV